MNVVREAFVLPIIFLTVTLLGGLRVGAEIRFLPPALTAVVLGVLTIASVIRAGAWDPTEVVNHARSPARKPLGHRRRPDTGGRLDSGLQPADPGSRPSPRDLRDVLLRPAAVDDRRHQRSAGAAPEPLRAPRLGVRASLHRAGIGVRPKRRHVDARAHDADGGRLARDPAVRSEWARRRVTWRFLRSVCI